MLMTKTCASLVIAAAVFFCGSVASSRRHKPRVIYHDPRAQTPATTYAGLGKTACLKELSRRKIPYSEVAHAPGVAAPVRLLGRLEGVLFRIDTPPTKDPKSAVDLVDCRLALALFDFAKVLSSKGIDEVHVASAWRPPKSSWPRDAKAKRHPGGLAIDVKRFGKKLTKGETEKRWIVVASDFRGKIGSKVCGSRATQKTTNEGALLRSIVCEAAKANLFTSILTPNYDRAHRDHFHFEITKGVAWTLLL